MIRTPRIVVSARTMLTGALLLSLTLMSATIASRPLLPVDETRYLSVAWEMHERGDYLVSHLNGETYSHKPPLLFWIINVVWQVMGVHETAARFAAPCAALGCLILTGWLANLLWRCGSEAHPSRSLVNSAPLILASMLLWQFFCPLTMFDTLLTCFVLTAHAGILTAAGGSFWFGWILAGISLGLGILTKGPVVLVHVLPAAVLAPWWSDRRLKLRIWYSGCLGAVLLATVMGLSWAIPSAISGGDAYGRELLLGQTAGRMVSSFAHRRPFWWYFPWLPLCLMPWISYGVVWRGLFRTRLDQGLRYLICWTAGTTGCLSAVSGKQIYYLLPLMPAAALLSARLIAVGDPACGASASNPAPAEQDANSHRVSLPDLLFIVIGTTLMGVLPLIFNHVPGLSQTSLFGLVPDAASVPLAGCGLILVQCAGRSVRFATAAIAAAAITFVAVLSVSMSQSLWKDFELQPLARFAADTGRPLAWFGNYHGQLNFTGRIRRVDELLSENQLEAWWTAHPDGAVIVRILNDLSLEDAELLESLSQQSPDAVGREKLAGVLSRSEPEFLKDPRTQPIRIQWIRRGLPRDPHLIVIREP